MRRLLWLALLPLFGCGGGGGGGGSTVQAFPFDGAWVGTWSCPATSESGSFSVFIGGEQVGYPDGHSAVGTATNGVVSGDVSGSVSKFGNLFMRIGFQPRRAIAGYFTVNGDSMTGTVTMYFFGGAEHPATISLSRS